MCTSVLTARTYESILLSEQLFRNTLAPFLEMVSKKTIKNQFVLVRYLVCSIDNISYLLVSRHRRERERERERGACVCANDEDDRSCLCSVTCSP